MKPKTHPTPSGMPCGLGSAGRRSSRVAAGADPGLSLPVGGTSLQSSQGMELWVSTSPVPAAGSLPSLALMRRGCSLRTDNS